MTAASFDARVCPGDACTVKLPAAHRLRLDDARELAARRSELEAAFLRSEDAVADERLRAARNAHRARRREGVA